MRLKKSKFRSLVGVLVCLGFGSTVQASVPIIDKDPKLNKANVYKYLKDEQGNCLTSHLDCSTQNKSVKQLSKGYGFVGTNYALDSSDPNVSKLLDLEGSGSADAMVHKYSGPTGTYTAKHYPVAIEGHQGRYTYFIYSGPALGENAGADMIAAASKTSSNSEVDNPDLFLRNYGNGNSHSNVIGIYIARYDHVTDKVSSPLLVHAKWTDDPHDNASLNRDSSGNLYVFVAGRNRIRGGFFYKISPQGAFTANFDAANWQIEDLGLENITYTVFNTNVNLSDASALDNRYVGVTYPKLFWVQNGSYFRLIYTVYCAKPGISKFCHEDNTRQLWSAKLDTDGSMSELTLLSAVGGHYAVANSTPDGEGIVAAFNWHRDSNVDRRTNLYVLYSTNGGSTWKTSNGSVAQIPFLTESALDDAKIVNYNPHYEDPNLPNRYVYVKDMYLAGNASSGTLDGLKPAVLFVRSVEQYPVIDTDPENNNDQDQHQMNVSFRYNGSWYTREITDELDHNFSTGSLYPLGNNKYRVFFPGLKNADSNSHRKAGGYTNALAGGVFSHVDFQISQTQITPSYMLKSAQKKPQLTGYLTGLCEVNYVRTVHHGKANSKFAAVMSAANPQRFEAFVGSPNNHLPAAPLLYTSKDGDLYKLPMTIDQSHAEHSATSVNRNAELQCQ